MTERRGVCFECEQDRLYGVLDLPSQPNASGIGVLIVVGGPQYRVGSHRQFALLARALAGAGWPAMRFDYRGMGDSEGQTRAFDDIDADIRAAVDCLTQQCPDVSKVVLWGLCDAVPAALFYAHQDERIGGLVLLNPWVRTESGLARTYVKRYYTRRLFERSFWRKVFGGGLDIVGSLREFAATAKRALAGRREGRAATAEALSLPDRMRACMQRYTGPCLFVLSGDDLTAGEFRDVVEADSDWRRLMAGESVDVKTIAEANHTFSRRQWRDQVAALTIDWLGAR